MTSVDSIPASLEHGNRTGGLPRRILRIIWANTGMAVIFSILFLVLCLCVQGFFTWINLTRSIGLSVTIIGMISCTMLFCMAAGDFDLSVGSVVILAGVLAAQVTNTTHSVFLGIAAAVLAGGIVGLTNGVIIAVLGINALIATLATMQIVRGLAFFACDGKSVGVNNRAFFALGNTAMVGIPTPVWIMIACFVIFGLLLRQTTFGRNTLAIGGNPDAARLAGIHVQRTKVIIFSLQGLISGFAGVILASRLFSGQPNIAPGLELQVISACVLGGVSLTGGVGRMSGVVIGVLLMGTVQDAMNLMNIGPFFQYIVGGSILLAAVMFDKMRHRTIC